MNTTLANLEEGLCSYAFTAATDAVNAVLHLLEAGDEVIATADLHPVTRTAFTKKGIKVTYVETSEDAEIATAISPRTGLIWIETPSHSRLKESSIPLIAAIAHAHECLLCVDNTIATPILQRPLLQGADLVIHLSPLYLDHPAVVVRDSLLGEHIRFVHERCGISGEEKNIATLGQRIQLHYLNAAVIADVLAQHDTVAEVFYPSVGGGMVSFRPRLTTIEAVKGFVQSVKLFKPALFDSGRLIRLSVGLEKTDDLIRDIRQALSVKKSIFQLYQEKRELR